LQADYDAARKYALDASRSWAELESPYEAAVARLLAGDALAAEGKADAARHEWDTAYRAFSDYGSPARAAEALSRLDGGPSTPTLTATNATFRRIGDTRVISFAGGRESALPDLVGLRYIAHLLEADGREVAATALVSAANSGAEIDQLGLPALDEQARAAYRRRLSEIDAEIDDARANNDVARADLAARDRDFLMAELGRAVGLGGRIRSVGGSAERARTSVFRAIRYALDRVAQVEPSLAAHLRRGIRTGTMCSYQPDPIAPVRWRL
jgi:hypothetical protein